MLFKTRFHEGIRNGSVTMTFRSWKGPKVKTGGRYRFGAGEVLEVDSVESVELGSIGDREARAAGFASPAELRRELEPLEWTERLDWKSLALIAHVHTLEHVDQSGRILKRIRGSD